MTLFAQSGNSSSRIATSRAAISSRRPRLPSGLVRLLRRRTARSCQAGLRAGIEAIVSRTSSSAETALLGDSIQFSFHGDNLPLLDSESAYRRVGQREFADAAGGCAQGGTQQKRVDHSVTNYEDVFVSAAVEDVHQEACAAAVDCSQGFTAGQSELFGKETPGRKFVGESVLDGRELQACPRAVVDLPQPIIYQRRTSVVIAQNLRCAAGADEGTRDDPRPGRFSMPLDQSAGLSNADAVQRNIAKPLQASLLVPACLAMPKEVDIHGRLLGPRRPLTARGAPAIMRTTVSAMAATS